MCALFNLMGHVMWFLLPGLSFKMIYYMILFVYDLVYTSNPDYIEASFGSEEFHRNTIGYDSYRIFSFRALWFLGMDSYSYIGLVPILHISYENKNKPRLNEKNSFGVNQMTSCFLFLFIGFEIMSSHFLQDFYSYDNPIL